MRLEAHQTATNQSIIIAAWEQWRGRLTEERLRAPVSGDSNLSPICPLNFLEFQGMQNQTIYCSATPSKRELEWSRGQIVELVVRLGCIATRVALEIVQANVGNHVDPLELG